MSLESYRKRVLSEGKNIQEATVFETKKQQVDYILDSPSRKDVIINMDERNILPSIPSDIDTFEIRRFLFMPDMKVYMGDYICHDGFVYLAMNQTTDKIFPQVIARNCNFDFPIGIREDSVQIGTKPNGEPIMKTKITHMVKPCVMTSKIYDIVSNSQVNLPAGSMSVYLPYVEGEQLPVLNQSIDYKHAQYKVTDLIFEKVILFNGVCEKGYIEVRLQRVMNTHDK